MKRALLLVCVGWIFCADAAKAGVEGRGHDRIMAMMDTMVFDQIDFKDATIEEVTAFLTQKTKEMDPDSVGVRLVFQQGPFPNFKITLDEKKVPLRLVLKQIGEQANCYYAVGEDEIGMFYFSGDGASRGTFTVPEGFIHVEAGKAPSKFYDVARQLDAKGLDIAPGWSAVYQPSQRQLIAVGSCELMEDIDHALFKARAKAGLTHGDR